MTPAALKALISGDAANFIAASTPGGIEAQERAGQIRDTLRETLPKEMQNCTRETFEALGFVFLGEEENIFWTCQFPKGWRKQPTEHSMWSRLLDDKGRERAMIFFKAAFYDFNAHIHLSPRYEVRRADPYESRILQAFDAATQEALQTFPSAPEDSWCEASHRQAEAWLTEHFPDWRNPIAYWDR